MKPSVIFGATNELGAPQNWNTEVHGPCAKLFVRIDGDVFQSAWKPSPQELQILNEGGAVVIGLVGAQLAMNVVVEPARSRYHPLASPHNKSGALGMNAGDRVAYCVDDRLGYADEFTPDGDAYVSFDDGEMATVKWRSLHKVPN